jgi:hypothetical protein
VRAIVLAPLARASGRGAGGEGCDVLPPIASTRTHLSPNNAACPDVPSAASCATNQPTPNGNFGISCDRGVSPATNFAANIRLEITSSILLASSSESLSRSTAGNIRIRCARIEQETDSWSPKVFGCFDSGTMKFWGTPGACWNQFWRALLRADPHPRPLSRWRGRGEQIRAPCVAGAGEGSRYGHPLLLARARGKTIRVRSEAWRRPAAVPSCPGRRS